MAQRGAWAAGQAPAQGCAPAGPPPPRAPRDHGDGAQSPSRAASPGDSRYGGRTCVSAWVYSRGSVWVRAHGSVCVVGGWGVHACVSAWVHARVCVCECVGTCMNGGVCEYMGACTRGGGVCERVGA